LIFLVAAAAAPAKCKRRGAAGGEPPEKEIPIPDDMKLPRTYTATRERPVHREDVTKAYALLKTRAPSWYNYTVKSSESVIAATRGIYPFC
jgi:hypothetical protein